MSINEYNDSEFNHYGMCRTYRLTKDRSEMLTQYVTKEKKRAEKAEARAKIAETKLEEIANMMGYPHSWDTSEFHTLMDAVREMVK